MLTATLIGVAACGGGGSAPLTLPVVHPLGASPTPTRSAISEPVPVRRATPLRTELAAVTAAVRRYYAVANSMRRDMRPQALAVLFEPTCVCQAQVQAVRLARARHEHYVDQARLTDLIPSTDGPGKAVVLVALDVSRGGLVTTSGRRVTSVPPVHQLRRLFTLHHRHGRWLISSISEVR